MTTSVESIKQAIADNRNKLNALVAEIRANEHYSGNGKADLIATAHEQSQARHEALLHELEEFKENTRARLERAAFNAPLGREDSYRSAVQSASLIKDNDRTRMIEMALKTGDTLQLRALAAVGHAKGEWGTVRAVAPHDKNVAALVDFEAEHGVLRGNGQKFGQSIEITRPDKPAEAAQAHAPDSREYQ